MTETLTVSPMTGSVSLNYMLLTVEHMRKVIGTGTRLEDDITSVEGPPRSVMVCF